MQTTDPLPQGRHCGKGGRSKQTIARLCMYLDKQENRGSFDYSLMSPIVPRVPKEPWVAGLCSHPASDPGVCWDIPKISSCPNFPLLPEREILLSFFAKPPVKHRAQVFTSASWHQGSLFPLG